MAILNFLIVCNISYSPLSSILMKGFFCILDCASVRWSMINTKLWSINILYQRTLHKILGHNFVVWPIQEPFNFALMFFMFSYNLAPTLLLFIFKWFNSSMSFYVTINLKSLLKFVAVYTRQNICLFKKYYNTWI